MFGKLPPPAGALPTITSCYIADAIYRGLLGRKPSASELTNLSNHLETASLEHVFLSFISSIEFRNRMMNVMIPAPSLPDLKAIIPEHYTLEATSYGEMMSVFEAKNDSDFDLIESFIKLYRYYDIFGVWTSSIDLDKKITAAIVRGLGAKTCFEIGCFTGAVISVLTDSGIECLGLDMSHLAFVFSYPNSNRGKRSGSQADWQRCVTISGRYGTLGWVGAWSRSPK